jgi:tRNA(fMet)-specific endonuclease VapC
MSFVLDTDICSAHLRNVVRVSTKFLQYTGRLNISAVTLGELLSWTLRSKSPPKYHQGLLTMLSDVVVFDVDQTVAWKFGEVRAQLLDQGQAIASIDLLIAATALVHGMTVVTHNVQHFSNVPGLTVEDWLGP